MAFKPQLQSMDKRLGKKGSRLFYLEDTKVQTAHLGQSKVVYVYVLVEGIDALKAKGTRVWSLNEIAEHATTIGEEDKASMVLADVRNVGHKRRIELPNDLNHFNVVTRPVEAPLVLSIQHLVDLLARKLTARTLMFTGGLPTSGDTSLSFEDKLAIKQALEYVWDGVDEAKHKRNLEISKKFVL